MSASIDVPFPPLHLANRVLSLEGRGDPHQAYDRHGAETKEALLALLPEGWSFEGKRVLDFGCGAGRTLRHFLAEAEHGEFWGVDIDAPSIDWLQGTLCPPLRVRRSGVTPRLGFEDGAFDLIWAISVFTHLADTSIPWLLELHRLLAPDGLLMATYMGRWNSEVLAGEPWDEDRVGINVLRHNKPWDNGGPDVLMSDWWVRAHWGRAFEILEVAPQIHNQTWAMLRRRDVELTVEDVERPADDPREYQALRHNLRQLQRELELVEGRLRREYEGSSSWQVTRPFREGVRVARSLGARRRRRP
jgi:SAM-dependent methyltransferase